MPVSLQLRDKFHQHQIWHKGTMKSIFDACEKMEGLNKTIHSDQLTQ